MRAESYQFHTALPGDELPQLYFDCRYAVLREPLDLPQGSERLADDPEAIHVWAEEKSTGEIVAVGRAHLLDEEGGAGSDHEGEDSPKIPAFEPLLSTTENFPRPELLRPAIQIRQMGTRPAHRRSGVAARLLTRLEEEAVRHWEPRSGWLQARTEAVAFYEACGWKTYGEEYDIAQIGGHRSAWRRLQPPVNPRKIIKPRRDLTTGALFRPHENWVFFEGPEIPEGSFADCRSDYDPHLAWLLAEASMLSYSRENNVVEREWAKVGFDECRFFDGPGAQGHLALRDDAAVLVFRGTEPDDVDDMRSNINIRLVRSPGGRGDVHHGFSAALVEVWPDIIRTVREIGDRPFWITGHSLGGALAVLAGETLESVCSVYTYGAPRVGNSEYRDAYPFPVHRLVHNNDIVPMLPPPLKYRHVGEPVFIDENGDVQIGSTMHRRNKSRLAGALDDLQTVFDTWRQNRYDALPDSRLTDHAPRNYILPLRKQLLEEGPTT